MGGFEPILILLIWLGLQWFVLPRLGVHPSRAAAPPVGGAEGRAGACRRAGAGTITRPGEVAKMSTITTTPIGLKRQLSTSYEEALGRLPEALKSEGFGVLTEVDVTATLKKKLDVDFRRYRILGACHPPSAHKALTANLDVGLTPPCNVVVYEGDDRRAVVMAIDPMRTMAAGDPAVAEVARDVQQRLTRVLERME